MNALAGAVLVLSAGIAPSAPPPDPVTACRDAHADVPARHIACLEQALESLAAAASTVGRAPSGLGAEQVRAGRARDGASERMPVRIVSVTYGVRGLATFRMADGQVWEETEKTPTHQRLAGDREYEAYIVPGTLGGYRMYVDGLRRMIKLRRVE
jgi:hypothetical protein